MKIIALLALISLSAISCTTTETQVSKLNIKISAIPNVHGNAMILTAPQFAIQYVSLLNVIPVALNLKTQFVMSNVKNQNVKLNAQIKDAKCLTVLNV